MSYEISDRMASLKPSAIREILKYGADPEVISLAAGDPAPESLPEKEISEILGSLIDEDGTKALLYSQSEGHPPLRERMRQLVEERYNIKTKTENILMTSGAQQCMDLITKVVCNEGDTIICENPSFVGALNTFRSYSVNLVGVDIEENGINLAMLEKALVENPKTKMIYLIPNFQNPSGTTMSLEKRKAIYELAVKHEVLILEDNPYGELRFNGEDVAAIKTFDREDIVFYAGSFSKILSSGIRLGYLVSPSKYMPKIVVAKQCVDVHTSMLSQLVCYNYLTKYDLNAHVEKLKKIYKAKCDLMLDSIDTYFPKNVKYAKPEGGLFIWCTLPDGMDGEEFAKEMVTKNKVCIVPGSAFLIETGAKSNSFRLNFSKPSKEDIVKGIKIIGESLRGKISE